MRDKEINEINLCRCESKGTIIYCPKREVGNANNKLEFYIGRCPYCGKIKGIPEKEFQKALKDYFGEVQKITENLPPPPIILKFGRLLG